MSNQITITKKGLKDDYEKFRNFYNNYAESIEKVLPVRYINALNEIKKIYDLLQNDELTQKDLKELEQISCKFTTFTGGGMIEFNKNISDFFKDLSQNINNTFEKYRNQEEDIFDKKSEYFDKIAKKNKFMSIWSMYDEVKKITDKFSDELVESVSYEGNTVQIGKIVTWLELWQHADTLIKMSGDRNHIFIEDFEEIKDQKGHLKLWTGS